MTHYVHYRDLHLTMFERPDQTWAVRVKRGHAGAALHIRMGDVLTLTNKSGEAKLTMKVKAFVPHYQSGKYCRSGHVVPH